MSRNLSTLSRFSEKYEDAGFTVPSLRWLRYREEENGFASAFKSVGGRVLIDEDEFFRIIDRQNGRDNEGGGGVG